MASNMSTNSTSSDVFYVKHSSKDPNLPRPNTPIVLNSTEMSVKDTREMISISSIVSHKAQIVTIDTDLNEPTKPYGFGRQLPIIPPCLNNLNLPPNPFNILATMVVVNPTEDGHDENFSPQAPEPSDPSPISTPPMNLCTNDGWEISHTTMDYNTFYSEDESRRVHWISLLDETFHSEGEARPIYMLSTPSPPPPPRKMKRKLEMGMFFPKTRGLSQHVCEACRQKIPQQRTFQDRPLRTKNSTDTISIFRQANKFLIVFTYI